MKLVPCLQRTHILPPSSVKCFVCLKFAGFELCPCIRLCRCSTRQTFSSPFEHCIVQVSSWYSHFVFIFLNCLQRRGNQDSPQVKYHGLWSRHGASKLSEEELLEFTF